jgi:hypothetical protein
MAGDGFAYLYGRSDKTPDALPSPIPPSSLPSSFHFNSKEGSTFADDRWRAIVGFARKIQISGTSKYEMRCMDRICDSSTGGGIPFFEYRWAYFFADAYTNSSLWGDIDPVAYKVFDSKYKALPSTAPGSADVGAWQAASDTLLSLCRSDVAGDFAVPTEFGIFSGKLPGYWSGMGKIKPTKDVDCAAPVCPEAA